MTLWKVSGECRKFRDCLETFQTVWKLSRPSGNFPDRLETFRTKWKLSRPSGNSPDSLESFHTYLFFSSVDVNFVNSRKNFPDAQNFPVGNADAPTRFFGLCNILHLKISANAMENIEPTPYSHHISKSQFSWFLKSERKKLDLL